MPLLRLQHTIFHENQCVYLVNIDLVPSKASERDTINSPKRAFIKFMLPAINIGYLAQRDEFLRNYFQLLIRPLIFTRLRTINSDAFL